MHPINQILHINLNSPEYYNSIHTVSGYVQIVFHMNDGQDITMNGKGTLKLSGVEPIRRVDIPDDDPSFGFDDGFGVQIA